MKQHIDVMVFYRLNNENASEEDFEVRESRKRKRQSQNNIHKDAIHPRKKKMKLQSISKRCGKTTKVGK